MSNKQGSYTVVGMVTGTHLVEDINVTVPHQVAVDISADDAHRSRDLWIGIDQKRLFLLKGHSRTARAVPQTPAPSLPTGTKESDNLRVELDTTRKELAVVQKKLDTALSELAVAQDRNTSLQETRASLQEDHAKKLETIVTMLSRLETGQVNVVEGVQEALQAVEAPVFIPGKIQPVGAEANIQPKEGDVLKKSSVKGAASTLRALRKGKGKK
jgi:hypothetical protein